MFVSVGYFSHGAKILLTTVSFWEFKVINRHTQTMGLLSMHYLKSLHRHFVEILYFDIFVVGGSFGFKEFE
jgi:hypothetical protein